MAEIDDSMMTLCQDLPANCINIEFPKNLSKAMPTDGAFDSSDNSEMRVLTNLGAQFTPKCSKTSLKRMKKAKD